MVIINLKKIGKGKIKLTFDSGQSITVYNKDIHISPIEEGVDVSDKEYLRVINEVLIPRARKRALYLLEKMDRTKKQIIDKLKDGGYPDEVIDKVVAYLEEYHFIDDERYSRHYVEYHKDKKSVLKVRSDLMSKGISQSIIDKILEETEDFDELSQIKRFLEKKCYNPDDEDIKKKKKLYDALLRKGFKTSDISHVMNIYENTD